jgi:plastocyanin
MKVVLTLLPAVALVLAACGGSAPEQPAASPAISNPVDPSTAATVQGTVRLEGTPPPAKPIDMRADPYCERQGTVSTEYVVVGSGGALANVFVYVKDGLGNLRFPVPETPVVLDQKGCMYRPRVLGIQVGQTLELRSSDDTLHNIHALPAINREFNKAQPLSAVRLTHVFSAREVMVPFRCDVHRWMDAWVGVLDHPFYAVTGTDGAFALKGLPPGTYTIEAWHEKLGTQTQTVTVGEKESRTVSFTFKI